MNSEPAKPAADAAKPAPAPSLPPVASGLAAQLGSWGGRKKVAVAASAVFSLVAGIAGLRLMLPSSDDGKSQTPTHQLASDPQPGSAEPASPIPPTSVPIAPTTTTLPTNPQIAPGTASAAAPLMPTGLSNARFKLTDATINKLKLSVPEFVLRKLKELKDLEYTRDDFEKAITRVLGPEVARRYQQTILIEAMEPDPSRIPNVAPTAASGGGLAPPIPIAQAPIPPTSPAFPVPTPTPPPVLQPPTIETTTHPIVPLAPAVPATNSSITIPPAPGSLSPISPLPPPQLTQSSGTPPAPSWPTPSGLADATRPAQTPGAMPAIPTRPPELNIVPPSPAGLQQPPVVQSERGRGDWHNNAAAPVSPALGLPGTTQLPPPVGVASNVPAVAPAFPDLALSSPGSMKVEPAATPPLAPTITQVGGLQTPKPTEPSPTPVVPVTPPAGPVVPVTPPAGPAMTLPQPTLPAVPVQGTPPSPTPPSAASPTSPNLPAISSPNVPAVPPPTDLNPRPPTTPVFPGLNPSPTPPAVAVQPPPVVPPTPPGVQPPQPLTQAPVLSESPARQNAQSGNRGSAEAPVAPVQRGTPSVVPASASGASASATPQRPPSTSYDVDVYEAKASDTWESISQEFYNNKSYAAALRTYNRQTAATPSGNVDIPPIYILKQKYQAPTKPVSVNTQQTPPASPPPTASWGPSTATTPAGTPPDARVYRAPAGGASMRAIARTTLGSDGRWMEIYNMNPKLRPDFVPEGTEVLLPADARLPN
jgi:hypothetical protein